MTVLLARVTAPTLVLHRREIPRLPGDLARALAAQIPDARLAILAGESSAPYLGDTEDTAGTHGHAHA